MLPFPFSCINFFVDFMNKKLGLGQDKYQNNSKAPESIPPQVEGGDGRDL